MQGLGWSHFFKKFQGLDFQPEKVQASPSDAFFKMYWAHIVFCQFPVDLDPSLNFHIFDANLVTPKIRPKNKAFQHNGWEYGPFGVKPTIPCRSRPFPRFLNF